MIVTIGELLGIYDKAKSMDWKALSTQLGKASTVKAITNVVAAQTLNAFKTVVSSFSVVQQANDILVAIRPIINLASQVGQWTNPAIWPKIGAEAISIIKKLLMGLALSGINQLKSYILGIEINLGNLTAKNINNMNTAIKAATNKSFKSIASSIKGYGISVSLRSTPLTDAAIASALDPLITMVLTGISSAVDMNGIQSAVSSLTQSQTAAMNMAIYGQSSVPNTGALANYNKPITTIFTPPDLDTIVNPLATYDPSVIISLAENPDTVREMLDAIEESLQEDKKNLIANISSGLDAITAEIDSSGLQESDAIILENLKNNFLQAAMAGQMNLVQAALDSILNYDDVSLKNILILFMKKYSEEVNASLESANNQINNLIASFPGAMPFVDKQAAVLDLATSLLANLPIPEVVLRIVIFEYLYSIYNQLVISNGDEELAISEQVAAFFASVQREYLRTLIEAFKKIRLINKTIEDNYYSYSYSAMSTSLQNQIILRCNTTIVNNNSDFNDLKTLLLSDIQTIESGYTVSVTEQIPHTISETIGEKIQIARGSVLEKIKNIVYSTAPPSIDYTQFQTLTTDTTNLVNNFYAALCQQYQKAIIQNAFTLIFNSLDGIAALANSDFEYKLYIQHTAASDQKLKLDLYNQCYFIIYNALYTSGVNALRDDLVNYVSSFNYTLDYPVAFSSLLKELEISIIQNIIDHIGV